MECNNIQSFMFEVSHIISLLYRSSREKKQQRMIDDANERKNLRMEEKFCVREERREALKIWLSPLLRKLKNEISISI